MQSREAAKKKRERTAIWEKRKRQSENASDAVRRGIIPPGAPDNVAPDGAENRVLEMGVL
jgi:hypothetical protein